MAARESSSPARARYPAVAGGARTVPRRTTIILVRRSAPTRVTLTPAVKRGGFKYNQMLDDAWAVGVDAHRNTGKTYARSTNVGGGIKVGAESRREVARIRSAL